LIRVISPLYTIRLRETRSERIGHFAGEPDMYLAEKQLTELANKTVDFFCLKGEPICNHQLARMWSRRMKFVPLMRFIIRANRLFPGWEKHDVPWMFGNDRKGILLNTKPFLEFSEEENIRGESELRKICGSNTKPIVAVFNRDSSYLNKSMKGGNWSYHDYRDSKIEHYIQAMEWLANKGYIVMRMGASVEDPIQTHHKNIIDYANLHRSDFLDVYIMSKCEFQVAAVTGLQTVGIAFRKPSAHVNASPFLTTTFHKANLNELFVPKLYFSEAMDRFLSVREIISMNAHNFFTTEQFSAAKISLRENDEIDILNTTREIEGLHRKTLSFSDEEISLQRLFWSEAGLDYDDTCHFPQPSPAFLIRHKKILLA
jgi:putative glycosyltransferase (TIGR04372 family)